MKDAPRFPKSWDWISYRQGDRMPCDRVANTAHERAECPGIVIERWSYESTIVHSKCTIHTTSMKGHLDPSERYVLEEAMFVSASGPACYDEQKEPTDVVKAAMDHAVAMGFALPYEEVVKA